MTDIPFFTKTPLPELIAHRRRNMYSVPDSILHARMITPLRKEAWADIERTRPDLAAAWAPVRAASPFSYPIDLHDRVLDLLGPVGHGNAWTWMAPRTIIDLIETGAILWAGPTDVQQLQDAPFPDLEGWLKHDVLPSLIPCTFIEAIKAIRTQSTKRGYTLSLPVAKSLAEKARCDGSLRVTPVSFQDLMRSRDPGPIPSQHDRLRARAALPALPDSPLSKHSLPAEIARIETLMGSDGSDPELFRRIVRDLAILTWHGDIPAQTNILENMPPAWA